MLSLRNNDKYYNPKRWKTTAWKNLRLPPKEGRNNSCLKYNRNLQTQIKNSTSFKRKRTEHLQKKKNQTKIKLQE